MDQLDIEVLSKKGGLFFLQAEFSFDGCFSCQSLRPVNTKWRELPWRSTVITIWLNNGSGTFTASTLDFGTNDSTGVALGDLDNDGDIDAFVTNNNSRPDNVWLNDGSGTLVDSGQNLGADNTFAVTLGDLDGDGDLDAFVANSGGSNTVCINLTPPKKIPIDLLLLDD